MLELLILYMLNKCENTLYGLKKEIATHYGEVSIPSHGALFPAIKRLENAGLLKIRKKLSDGGKRYTYYSVDNISSYFNKKFIEFNNAKSETLDNFLNWLKIRLIVVDMLDETLIGEFKEKCLLKFDIFKKNALSKLDNKYLELTEIQKNLLQISINEIEVYTKIIKEL